MNKFFLITAISVLIASPVAAQQANNVNPGVITPDIPVAWQLDQAWDSVTKNPGEIAQERASEALVMQERNRTRAMERAINATERQALQANRNHTEGLQNAEDILTQVRDQTPTEARRGLNNALRNIGDAKNREPPVPDNARPNNVGPQTPQRGR